MTRESDDYALLRQYVETGSEAAFAHLVARHTDMVYSSALRQVPQDMAEEVTQAVFILLLKKAPRLPEGTIVAAWLHKATRFTALNAMKMNARRRRHERKAGEMSLQRNQVNPAWTRVSPLLDEAISRLNERDRSAVVLRFMEQRSLADVGMTLGISENAAQMRVQRAVEKMRGFFQRRGIVITAAALSSAVAVNATQAAPPHLAASLGADTLRAAKTSGAQALARQSAHAMAWAHARVAAGLFVAAVAGLCSATLVVRQVVNDWPSHISMPTAQTPDNSAPIQLTHAVTSIVK